MGPGYGYPPNIANANSSTGSNTNGTSRPTSAPLQPPQQRYNGQAASPAYMSRDDGMYSERRDRDAARNDGDRRMNRDVREGWGNENAWDNGQDPNNYGFVHPEGGGDLVMAARQFQ